MPGGDRTGPRGLGSMGGRGLGYCTGYEAPGFVRTPGMGLGRSWNRGRGFGYGRGWAYRVPTYTPTYPPFPSGIVPKLSSENQLTMLKQEKDYLELEMKSMKSALEDISKRIADFEKVE